MVRHLLKVSSLLLEGMEDIATFMTTPYVFERWGLEFEYVPLELILGSGLTIYLIALIVDFFWIVD